MSNSLQKKTQGIFDLVARVGATIALLVIALVTFVDVIGREVFSHPIPGGYEIIQVLMTVGVFFSLPIVALRHGHVRVELFYQSFPPAVARLSDILAWIAGIVFFALLTYATFLFFLHATGTGERSVFLHVPYWLMALIMAVFLAATTICCLIVSKTPPATEKPGAEKPESEES